MRSSVAIAHARAASPPRRKACATGRPLRRSATPNVNGPAILSETWQVKGQPALFFAGQMSGVEGYVESAASGLMAGLNAVALITGLAPGVPPRTTAIGALSYYASHADPQHYEPSNITFGIIEPLEHAPRSRMERKLALSARALADLTRWMSGSDLFRSGRNDQAVDALNPVPIVGERREALLERLPAELQ